MAPCKLIQEGGVFVSIKRDVRLDAPYADSSCANHCVAGTVGCSTSHLDDAFPNDRPMRKRQSVDRLTETLIGSPPSERERGIDRLIEGLVDLLPKPDGIWRVEDRVKWLRLAADIFDLGYKANDGQSLEISIVALKQAPATTPLS